MDFVFWSSLFGVLYAYCIVIFISLFGLGKFSCMILLKIFSGTLNCDSSPYIPIILRFVFIIVSQISWMFCVRNILGFTFSLINVSRPICPLKAKENSVLIRSGGRGQPEKLHGFLGPLHVSTNDSLPQTQNSRKIASQKTTLTWELPELSSCEWLLGMETASSLL